MAHFPFAQIERISPRPLLLIAGENAQTLNFSQNAYKLAQEPKELMVIPGASHFDLYDRPQYVEPAVARMAARSSPSTWLRSASRRPSQAPEHRGEAQIAGLHHGEPKPTRSEPPWCAFTDRGSTGAAPRGNSWRQPRDWHSQEPGNKTPCRTDPPSARQGPRPLTMSILEIKQMRVRN